MARNSGALSSVLWMGEALGLAHNPLALLSRVLMATLFIREGVIQIADLRGTMDYMQGFGVWPQLAPLVAAVELAGGLLVLLGLGTRIAAIGLALFTLLAAMFFHTDFSDADQLIHFQKNLVIAGGFFALAALGPGAWSLDERLTKRVQR